MIRLSNIIKIRKLLSSYHQDVNLFQSLEKGERFVIDLTLYVGAEDEEDMYNFDDVDPKNFVGDLKAQLLNRITAKKRELAELGVEVEDA